MIREFPDPGVRDIPARVGRGGHQHGLGVARKSGYGCGWTAVFRSPAPRGRRGTGVRHHDNAPGWCETRRHCERNGSARRCACGAVAEGGIRKLLQVWSSGTHATNVSFDDDGPSAGTNGTSSGEPLRGTGVWTLQTSRQEIFFRTHRRDLL